VPKHNVLRRSAFLGLATLVALFTVSALAQELPDPTRYEKTVLDFEESDRLMPPPKDAIVLLGSSSIARWNEDAPVDLAPLTVIPRGFGGTVMNDALYYLDRLAINYKPRAILLYEGDNDTGRDNIPNDKIMDQLQQMVDRVHEKLPSTRIYVLSVKPSVAREETWDVAQSLNSRIAALAEQEALITYIDVATPFLKADGSVMTDIFVSDNLHLNEKGYDIWAATIREVLMRHEAMHE